MGGTGGDTVQLFGVAIGRMKKIQIHLGLWWRPIDSGTHNNQPTTGGCDRGEDGEEVQQVGAAQEAQHHHFQGGKVKEKILNIK